MDTLCIVAGEGTLPFSVARNARNQGLAVYVVGFEGTTDPSLEQHVDGLCWIKLGQLGKLISYFKNHEVTRAVFIGRIAHKVVFTDLKLDFKMLQLAMKLKDWRTDSILRLIADEITANGIEVIDSTTFIPELLPKPGILTRCKPDKKQQEDIHFGFYIAKRLAGLDVGQTVVVRKKSVCALEAIEGTNKAILRGGELGKKDVVVVKVSKPNQDMRFDVPVIGEHTIDVLKQANAAVLAIEAYKTILIEPEKVIAKADSYNIALVSADSSAFEFSKYETNGRGV
ncbi:MAG: LpxI family protein [Candidatus Auribacter fodinae]|jgi:DUF1009 family protein|uniref:LpxI family protein n=1 Tax=Candidatus Auribacter fodinae TaxID=2093366 RepID=A0A3A4QXR5_9BACT|nr:MAG: LpxI family protein [Candidatus Auribacter fodinae]